MNLLTRFFEFHFKDEHQLLKRFVETLKDWQADEGDFEKLKARLQTVGLLDLQTFPALQDFLSLTPEEDSHSDWFAEFCATTQFEDAVSILTDRFYALTAPITQKALLLLSQKALPPEELLHRISYSYGFGFQLSEAEIKRWLNCGKLLNFWRNLGRYLALGLRGETYLERAKKAPKYEEIQPQRTEMPHVLVEQERQNIDDAQALFKDRLIAMTPKQEWTFEEFGFSAADWSENPSGCLFQLLVFSMIYDERKDLNEIHLLWDQVSPVLEEIRQGVMPQRLTISDAALVLKLSLIARRLAEHADLPDQIAASDARTAILLLNEALGQDLFFLEIFFVINGLKAMQALSDADRWTAIPSREVRDTLYRWGLIASPYATTINALIDASEAAYDLLRMPRADLPIRAFTQAMGCASPCKIKHCTVNCREKDDCA